MARERNILTASARLTSSDSLAFASEMHTFVARTGYYL